MGLFQMGVKMQILDHVKTLELLCESTKKCGMYINIYNDQGENEYNYLEVIKAAPYLESHNQVILESSGFILFDNVEEMLEAYNQTVGDDGPTKSNPYDGPCRVYAITCNPDGITMNENT